MSEKLEDYNKKRNFQKSKEPKGEKAEKGNALRFVVQHHLARKDHYDFRLQWDDVLLSWAIPKGPTYDVHEKRLAIHVEDHPLEYRNFEGNISKGEYGGGVVMIWDEGYWKPHKKNVNEQFKNGVLKFVLNGKRLKGQWALIRLKNEKKGKQDNWILIKEKDNFVQPDYDITQFKTSITTGRTMTEIREEKDKKEIKNPFSKTDVQLAKLVTEIPKGEDWLFEMKYDGYRIVAYIEKNKVKLITRNGHNYTEKFQVVTNSLLNFFRDRTLVLDGEMVVVDDKGKTDFGALQTYIKSPKNKNLAYMIFDLLALDGIDLRGEPLIERKNMLESILNGAPQDISYSKHIIGQGEEFFKIVCKSDLEGIVGKQADSKYSGTRNGSWIKYKCYKRQEFVIGGYSLSDKKNTGLSSLLLGYYEGENLIYAGRAGTGFSEAKRNELQIKFKSIIIEKTPFKNKSKGNSNEKIFWLKPKFVAEISFAEWTKVKQLRQASFKGLRIDKNPKDVKREIPDIEIPEKKEVKENIEKIEKKENSDEVEGIKITHPDKILFDNPKITKMDVIKYYEKVAERMLPYISNRILSIIRCPKGIKGDCFFKKHPNSTSKGVVTIPINTNGEKKDYFYIENKAGIISEAQMGTLEFHLWGSKVENLEKPDMMVFDLDPDEGMSLDRVRKGVKDLKIILDELFLKSYLKTSGGKGYHIVVPFKPSVSWNEFHDFSKKVVQVIENKWPDRYTSNVRKSSRKNKIFIDWMRNGRGATSVAPYSIRARKGASVSMPISWKELDTVAPNEIKMKDAIRRIEKKDPWIGFFDNNQQLQSVLKNNK